MPDNTLPTKMPLSSGFNRAVVQNSNRQKKLYGPNLIVSPAVSGITYWSLFDNGPLILDAANATTYTITQFERNGVTIKMWGQGGGGCTGGYSTGILNANASVTYTIRLNAGGGSGGSGSGWPGNGGAGGGYAGVFIGGTPLLIAGGGGGAGGAGRSGGGGGGTSGVAGGTSGNSEIGSQGGAGGTQSSGAGYLQGGTGGTGATGGYDNAGGGGGGGGGYYGGYGGGGGNDFGNTTRESSGGGGGSGYVNGSYIISGTTSTFANESDPNRGSAGNSGSNSRVVLTL